MPNNRFATLVTLVFSGAPVEGNEYYAPVTVDGVIHDDKKVFVREGGHVPDNPKEINGKKVKWWVMIPT